MKNKEIIKELSKKYDSFYLYDESVIDENAITLTGNFPDIEFLYSIKCNPNHNILKRIFSLDYGADAASSKEVEYALNYGLTKDKIYYSAPGKSITDIEETIDKSIIIADSINEIMKIQDIAQEKNISVSIGIRLNPDFSPSPSKFGIDEKAAVEFIQNTKLSNIKITGIHVHLKSQQLDNSYLSDYYGKMLGLSAKFKELLGHLDFINMGSGIGINYSANDKPLDIRALRDSVNIEFHKFKEKYPDTRLLIETGRYIACKSGIYVTKVLDKKVSRGKTYIILSNTLNGFIRPSLAALIKNGEAAEPLYTSSDAFQFLTTDERSAEEKVTLVGNLCTAADTIAEDVTLPSLEIGDVVIITNAGSYAYVLSPLQFSSQIKPVELYLTKDKEIRVL